MTDPNFHSIQSVIVSKGYKWFNSGCALNIVGIRNSATGNKVTNLFDDSITVSYIENGKQIFHSWPCTTEPGKKGVQEFHNAKGVAILVPGQYLNAYTIRLHKGQYEAVCQAGNVSVYRDPNKDLFYDTDKIYAGLFGINIHHSTTNGTSTFVENWSEGCQVFANINDFNEFLVICNKFKSELKNTFSYTLIESKDLI